MLTMALPNRISAAKLPSGTRDVALDLAHSRRPLHACDRRSGCWCDLPVARYPPRPRDGSTARTTHRCRWPPTAYLVRRIRGTSLSFWRPGWAGPAPSGGSSNPRSPDSHGRAPMTERGWAIAIPDHRRARPADSRKRPRGSSRADGHYGTCGSGRSLDWRFPCADFCI